MLQAADSPSIRFIDLGHYYHSGQWVFRGYSATIARGTICAVLGPNGRGKTTLLKALLGVLKPREGNLFSEGRIAYVPQLFDISFDYSVLDMVLMGRAREVRFFWTALEGGGGHGRRGTAALRTRSPRSLPVS